MKYITIKPHEYPAGIGHQFTNWLVPNILARRYDLKFVHQQFVGEIDGSNDPRGSNGYQITVPVKLWNDFLNFGEGQLTLQDLPQNLCPATIIPHIDKEEAKWDHPVFDTCLRQQIYDRDILFNVSELEQGQFINIDWDFYKNNNLKERYNNSKQVKNFKCYFNKDDTNIAITIRRGDVTKDQRHKRWMDIDYYQNIILLLSKIKFVKQPIFHVYSLDMPIDEQKRIFKIKELLTDGQQLQMHLDEDVFSTFYHLTKADIFVSGQGVFSLLANYLADGIKLTTPFYIYWNNFPLDIQDIVEIKPDLTFDSNKLLKALEKKNG